MSTALLALVSILVAPAASVACMARCDAAASTRQSAVCHHETHAQAQHLNHDGHMHQMAANGHDADAAFAGQHRHTSSLACHSAACSSAIPARPARALLSSQPLAASLYLRPSVANKLPSLDVPAGWHSSFSLAFNLSCSTCPPLRI